MCVFSYAHVSCFVCSSDLDLQSITLIYELDLHISSLPADQRRSLLCQGFQKLEQGQDRQTDRQWTYVTERISIDNCGWQWACCLWSLCGFAILGVEDCTPLEQWPLSYQHSI